MPAGKGHREGASPFEAVVIAAFRLVAGSKLRALCKAARPMPWPACSCGPPQERNPEAAAQQRLPENGGLSPVVRLDQLRTHNDPARHATRRTGLHRHGDSTSDGNCGKIDEPFSLAYRRDAE
ncbi:hypothetical protein MTO96_003156 [Rhipicephalus appendiculatus]